MWVYPLGYRRSASLRQFIRLMTGEHAPHLNPTHACFAAQDRLFRSVRCRPV
jgi:hypothetical protein